MGVGTTAAVNVENVFHRTIPMTEIPSTIRRALIGAAGPFSVLVLLWVAIPAVQSHEAGTPLGAHPSPPQGTRPERDGQHDFDFEIGVWRTHLKRLVNPLSGSTTWSEYTGTSVVRRVWDGRANLVELVAEGAAGRFEGLSLRLYNPQSRQWSLNFASSRTGTLSPPSIGEFRNGRGEFFSQESLDGRAIHVRFVISVITPDSIRFEQAFSADGGKTWEPNWIAVDTRRKGESGEAP